MRTVFRKLVLMVFLCLTAWTAAQPVAWVQKVDSTSGSKMISDTAGNLFWVTRDASVVASHLYLTKMRITGASLYRVTIDTLPPTFEVADVKTDGNTVFLAARHFSGSYYDRNVIYSINAATGAVNWRQEAFDSYDPYALVILSTQIGIVGTYRPGGNNPNQGFVRWLKKTDGTVQDTLIPEPLGSNFTCATSDANDCIYAAGSDANDRVVGKFQYGIGVWFYSILGDNHSNEQTAKVVLDPSQTKVLVIASGENGNFYPEDWMLSVVSASSGAGIASRNFDPNQFNDTVDDAIWDANGIYVSGSVGTGAFQTEQRVYALDPFLSTRWTVTPTDAAGYIKLASNSHGVFLATSLPNLQTGRSTWISRLRASDGAVQWSTVGAVDTQNLVSGVAVDAADDAFVVGSRVLNGDQGEFLARYQFAAVTFAQPTAYGGGTVTGMVRLGTATNANLTFTLKSNRPEAVVPTSVLVSANALQATFPVTTSAVPANTLVVITAGWNGVSVAGTFTLIPPVASTLLISPSSVMGGVNTAAVFNLSGKAPSGGTAVALVSNFTATATVPASTTVTAGNSAVGFTIITLPTLIDRSVAISATAGGKTVTSYVLVNAADLSSIALTPTSVTGGTPSSLLITLTGKSPTGNTVYFVSGVPALVVLPATVTMTPNVAATSVNVITKAVSMPVAVTVIAYQNGIVKTATLTLTP